MKELAFDAVHVGKGNRDRASKVVLEVSAQGSSIFRGRNLDMSVKAMIDQWALTPESRQASGFVSGSPFFNADVHPERTDGPSKNARLIRLTLRLN